MALFFFILGCIGALYSLIMIWISSDEELRGENATGPKLMMILICSILLIGLNATEISNNQLVIDFFTP